MSAVVIDRAAAPPPAARVAPDEPLIALDGVGKSFAIERGGERRTLRAVDGVSLDLRRGEVLAIVGESGSGKTTLGRIMLGLLAPSSGAVTIDGRPPAALGKRRLARLVQPIFQDPYSSLNARKTVGDIVGLPLRIHRLGSRAERKKKVEAMMERVGLPPALIHAFPAQLSGGQRQRVAIARALIIQPEIVVCDEPTSALDVSVQAQILNLLKDLRDEFDLTYLFISHNLGVVEFLADRIGVMYLGRMVELGEASAVLRRPRHPYTRALLGSVLTPDPALGLPETPLRGHFPDPLDPPPGCAFHPRCTEAFDRCAVARLRTLIDADGLIECHRHDPAVAAGESA